jgi:uncharacterized protein YcgI (DUF1989 family)
LRVLEDVVIPAGRAGAFLIPRGGVLRIYLVEARQVGDCCFFNADDHREVFHAGQTWALNGLLGTGTAKSWLHFYSKPPRENVMLTVVDDTVRNHWGNMGGRCSRRLYELRDGDTRHRSCQENLAEALAPHGLGGDDIVDVFNVFMNVELDAAGGFRILAPETKPGDYLELRAEMNILAAISACPADRNATNDGRAKPLGVRVSG